MQYQQAEGYYLPQETSSLLTPENIKKCKNLGLLLDKYAPQAAIQKSEGKSKWLKEITTQDYVDSRLAAGVYQRWLNITTAAGALHIKATTDWRMVVGLGGETVLETDLTLHHVYGLPFIPGSALKGLTRAYVTGEITEHKSKQVEDDSPLVKRIFGSQKSAGTVIFFDALPVDGKVEIALDIMNSHYPNYYAEKKLPTNEQNPNPITFLTVTNSTFMFALAPRNPENEQHVSDTQDTKRWLQEALAKYGIGGKTSAGYGYFNVVESSKDAQPANQASSATEGKPVSSQAERIRPSINLPSLRAGQDITGSVVAPTDELRKLAPEATAFLRYQSFATKDVLIVISAEGTQSWKPGETRICLYQRSEVRDGCTVLVCQPRPSKKKKDK